MNLVIFAVSVGAIGIIGEEIPWKEFCLLHIAYYLLQIELAGICFGISAFLRKGSIGVGLGMAAVLYFLNLIANITETAGFLKYITPFGYCDGADIAAEGRLDGVMLSCFHFIFSQKMHFVHTHFVKISAHPTCCF